MLKMPKTVQDQIRRHGEEAYPHECCGILLGIVGESGWGSGWKSGCQPFRESIRVVREAVATENASSHPENHYEIAPVELIRAERLARRAGLTIVGFYHSHPDHPAQPSATDLAEAHWLGCSYVITAVENGLATESTCFHLAGSHEEFKFLEPECLILY